MSNVPPTPYGEEGDARPVSLIGAQLSAAGSLAGEEDTDARPDRDEDARAGRGRRRHRRRGDTAPRVTPESDEVFHLDDRPAQDDRPAHDVRVADLSRPAHVDDRPTVPMPPARTARPHVAVRPPADPARARASAGPIGAAGPTGAASRAGAAGRAGPAREADDGRSGPPAALRTEAHGPAGLEPPGPQPATDHDTSIHVDGPTRPLQQSAQQGPPAPGAAPGPPGRATGPASPQGPATPRDQRSSGWLPATPHATAPGGEADDEPSTPPIGLRPPARPQAAPPSVLPPSSRPAQWPAAGTTPPTRPSVTPPPADPAATARSQPTAPAAANPWTIPPPRARAAATPALEPQLADADRGGSHADSGPSGSGPSDEHFGDTSGSDTGHDGAEHDAWTPHPEGDAPRAAEPAHPALPAVPAGAAVARRFTPPGGDWDDDFGDWDEIPLRESLPDRAAVDLPGSWRVGITSAFPYSGTTTLVGILGLVLAGARAESVLGVDLCPPAWPDEKPDEPRGDPLSPRVGLPGDVTVADVARRRGGTPAALRALLGSPGGAGPALDVVPLRRGETSDGAGATVVPADDTVTPGALRTALGQLTRAYPLMLMDAPVAAPLTPTALRSADLIIVVSLAAPADLDRTAAALRDPAAPLLPVDRDGRRPPVIVAVVSPRRGRWSPRTRAAAGRLARHVDSIVGIPYESRLDPSKRAPIRIPRLRASTRRSYLRLGVAVVEALVRLAAEETVKARATAHDATRPAPGHSGHSGSTPKTLRTPVV